MIFSRTIRAAASLFLATTAVGTVHADTLSAPDAVVAGKTSADPGVDAGAPGATGSPAGTDRDTGVATGSYRTLDDLSRGSHTPRLPRSIPPLDAVLDGDSVDQAITLNVTAVPEPASWALLLVGCGLAGAHRWMRPTAVVVA